MTDSNEKIISITEEDLNNTNIPVTGIESDTEKALQENASNSVEKLFEQLPLAYKMFAVEKDWMLVIGGIKGATDLNFFGDKDTP